VENIRNEAAVALRGVGVPEENLKLPKRKADVRADDLHEKGW
jgi:hypothetical protein